MNKEETFENLVDLKDHLLSSIDICGELGRWLTVSTLENILDGVEEEIELLREEMGEEGDGS